MNRIPLSTSFVLAALGLKFAEVNTENGYLSSYVGDQETAPNIWGEHFYLEINSSVTAKTIDYLVSNSNYNSHRITSDGKLLFKFNFTDEVKEYIVAPFLDGKYSLIDREYVNKNFNKYIPGTNRLSVNWMVLNKHESLKQYWEEQIQSSLPDDAEVWFKPEMKDEIYKFNITNDDTNTTSE